MDNIQLVKIALTEVFIEKDLTALDRYWSDSYIQHNPMIGNGREALMGLLSMMPDLKYEMGLVTGSGDFVMAHGRFTGFGPKPLIAVDIFRIQDGKLAEHWDVLQEEVPADQTVSKNPMFPTHS
jgi:predicted SnoaL-like aldol condensation-catalyzing enzyme